MTNSNINSGFVISYLTMRRIIGILGIGLPVIIVLGGFIKNGLFIGESISGYYYSNMRDFLVGLLCCVGLFLISYKGYQRIDHHASNISGIFALGTAFFPASNGNSGIMRVGIFQLNKNISGYVHLTFATLFFISLALISIFLFTRRESNQLTKEKRKRNLLYVICGCVILFSILCVTVYEVALQKTFLATFRPIMIFETLSLESFGISWLVKGETFFKDKEAISRD